MSLSDLISLGTHSPSLRHLQKTPLIYCTLTFKLFHTSIAHDPQTWSRLKEEKMNGYSKIGQVSISKSRSVDLSEHHTPLQTPGLTSNHSSERRVTTEIHDSMCTANHDSLPEKGQEEEVGEIFGVILSRSCSASSRSLKIDKQNPAKLENAIKRAFSMSRSSSVSQGYCRIHHQSDFIADEGKATLPPARNTKKNRGKIFNACKLLFGF